MTQTDARQSGFGKIEMLVGSALLVLLAAMALPQFLGREGENRQAAMLVGLSALQTAIDSYWTQHDGFPGVEGPEQFTKQLLNPTDRSGRIGTGDEYLYGPYLRDGAIPINPLTGTNSVRVVETMPNSPKGSEAWIYASSTGDIRCNVVGRTPDGVEFFSF
jgi:type II secretory pathway pseudopilin PulG